MPAIWWIRRDLRLTDNAALHAALETGSVIPAFILDPAFSPSSPRRKQIRLVHTSTAEGDWLILWLIQTVRPGMQVEDHPTSAGCYGLEA